MYVLKTLVLTSALAVTATATLDKFFQDRSARLTARPAQAVTDAPKAALADRAAKAAYLNPKSQKFVVDGTKLPEVPFDVGESYAGLIPISNKTDEERQLYFWFFPTEEPKASDEITIWLNGGPGCSSLLALLTENGPLQWQSGTLAPVKNPYSWNRLTNVVWVEQPVGTGFSQGTPNIKDELELAEQFKGFWKNFVDTFQLKGRKVYITGESYAGMYVPYIANSFLEANDTDYFNTKGIAINDPVIGDGVVQQILPLDSYVKYWNTIFDLAPATIAKIEALWAKSGYTDYTNKYFTFPPPKQPWAPSPDYVDGSDDLIVDAITKINPCFNIYHITDTCPTVFNHLGGINSGDYIPPGAQAYFSRPDVQRVINAPVGNWSQCGGSHGRVFPHGDASPGPTLDGTISNIVAKTKNAIIGSGALDFLLPTNGTLFALQNTTWGGQQGFHKYPSNAFIVPDHVETERGALAGSGHLGVWAKERGLTFYDIHLAGHEVPGYSAGAGYRILQVLLGRVKDFGSHEPLF